MSFNCLDDTCDIKRLVLTDPFRNESAHNNKHDNHPHTVALHKNIDVAITKVIFGHVVLSKNLGKAINSRSKVNDQNSYQQFVHNVSPSLFVS